MLEAPVEGAEPSATILRLLREQQALGLLCDAGFYELLRAEGIDPTQHPIAQRLPIALRSLEASASLEAARDRHGRSQRPDQKRPRGGRFVRRFTGKTAEEAPEVRGEAALRVLER